MSRRDENYWRSKDDHYDGYDFRMYPSFGKIICWLAVMYFLARLLR